MSASGVEIGDKDAIRYRGDVPSTKVTQDNHNESKDSLKRSKFEADQDFKLGLIQLEHWLAPLAFTALALGVRLYKISANNNVVWDEAHFGKFGSYYLRHEFYHDVHPPLGKMLIGLSGYLAGYNGSWDFPLGSEYPDYIDYTKMRIFQAVFSTLMTPFAYYTCKEIGYSIPTTWLFTIMVALEQVYVTLGKFILLDSMLLAFTVSTVFCFSRFNNFNNSKDEFGRKWWKWLLLTGVLIGCVTSVKMVGLFVTSLVGIYTATDLFTKLTDKKISWAKYTGHWMARIIGLILVPFAIFLLSFKVHFDLLYKLGTGDANMSSLFQANLVGSDIQGGARDVTMGHSVVTFKNMGLGGGLLHSHVQTFPEGSKQQQVTTYSHKDANNNWIFQRVRDEEIYDPSATSETEYIRDGMHVRIMHPNTGRNLHTHHVAAPVTKAHWEVAGYGNLTIGDAKDHWVIEVMDQLSDEDKDILHPLTTQFRLKNEVLGCYLGVSGQQLPAWGFRQGEVICYKNSFKKDKRTWWNIENNKNDLLPPPQNFTWPKTKFYKDFIQLNLAMMATNNALVPDHEKQDDLASSWWEWPTLYLGIRMCSWADDMVKYYMMSSPATTWTSTVGVIIFAFITLYYLIRWQRQIDDFPAENPSKLKKFVMGGIYPMFGWGLHFTPFVIMGRVTYFHHYSPALYFAMMVLVYEIDVVATAVQKNKVIYNAWYAFWFALVIGFFIFLAPLSFGMEGPKSKWAYLDVLPSWKVGNDNYR